MYRISLLPFLVLCSCTRVVLSATVTFNWKFSWITANVDGFSRPVVAVNGQFPLPTVNVTLGDQVVINAVNNLGNSSLTLHFHGIYQNGTNTEDGPFQVTQCGVPSGQSLTYSFPVKQPGTYFYHSHFEGQYPDGLRGPFIVHDPKSPFIGQYDEERVITLSDWYHDQMPTLTNFYLNSTLNPSATEPLPYSALLNDAQNVKLNIQAGKTYFLRIINYACFSQMYLHFDQHQMTIIEIDGIYVHPRTVDTLYFTVAQRYGVLLTAKKTSAQNYAALGKLDEWMFDGFLDGRDPSIINPNVNAYLVYNSTAPLPKPLNITLDTLNSSIIDDFTLTPYDNEPLLQNPTQTFVLDLAFFPQDGQNRAGFNNITWIPQKVPSLMTALTTGNSATDPRIYGVNSNPMVLNHNEVIEVVINNLDGGGHPIHIHGHAPQIVARVENGTYTPPSRHHHPAPVSPNPNLLMPAANSLGFTGSTSGMPRIPMRRDTWKLAAGGYTVIRFVADNPGVWFFHCHMDWHNIAGLAATFIEAPLALQKSQSIPSTFTQLCSSQNIPTQGNAAGNTHNFTDLTGANTVCPPLGTWVGPPPLEASSA